MGVVYRGRRECHKLRSGRGGREAPSGANKRKQCEKRETGNARASEIDEEGDKKALTRKPPSA